MMIRHATIRDLPVIRQIYDSAKQYMRVSGNPTQWDSNYPSDELLISDMEKSQLYVIEDDEGVHAVFVLAEGPDPTYGKIDGAWLSDRDYMVIHRIASDGKVRGVLTEALRFGFSRTESIRIDTHRDNHVMQSLLDRNGFSYCGVIYLENGDPRLAYQADT